MSEQDVQRVGVRHYEGVRFGRLAVINRADSRHWLCECDCGRAATVSTGSLTSGNTSSCGCLRLERNIAATTKHGHSRRTGHSRSYQAWGNMKARCLNKNNTSYPDYGGRGIVICDEWLLGFNYFLADMGDCPPGLTLERIDVNRNYGKENCCWATRKQQNNNTRSNIIVELGGRSMTLSQACEQLGAHYQTIYNRIFNYGWPAERALSEPIR